MLIEKILFNVVAFSLFIIIFLKMIKRNDTSYISILSLQFIGIAINFIALILNLTTRGIVKLILYILCILLPIAIIIMEKKNFLLSELIYISIAKWKIMTNKPDEARKYLIQLVSKIRCSYHGHKMLADIYEKEGKKEQAIEELMRTSELRPKEYQIHYKISELFYQIGKKDVAIEMLQDLVHKKPDYEEATNLLGNILYEQERYKEAISVYLDALQYHPTSYDIYYNLGMVYTMVNDFQKAKEYYEKAAMLNQLLYHAKLNLGQIALLYGDLAEAEAFFMESLQGKETETGSYYYLALVSILKGEKDKAIQYMNIAVEEEPELYEKVQKETVFLSIRKKVKRVPKLEKKKELISEKEIKVEKHLEETYRLVGNLNNIDLKAMQKIKQRNKLEKDREL